MTRTTGSGRSKISSNERTQSYSKRCQVGKLLVEEDKHCSNCGHDKVFTRMADNSPRFGESRCTKCGYIRKRRK